MLSLHSPYQANGCSLALAVFLDLPTHTQTSSQFSRGVAISRPFVNTGITDFDVMALNRTVSICRKLGITAIEWR